MQSQLSDSFCDREVIVLARDIDGSRAATQRAHFGTSDRLGRGGFPFKIAPVNPPTRAPMVGVSAAAQVGHLVLTHPSRRPPARTT